MLSRFFFEMVIFTYRSEEHPSYILTTKVLQSDITTGYEMSNQIVETINGKKENNMAHVIEAFKAEVTTNDKVDETEIFVTYVYQQKIQNVTNAILL